MDDNATRTSIRLHPEDREALESIRDHYGLSSIVAAIRVAARETSRRIEKEQREREHEG